MLIKRKNWVIFLFLLIVPYVLVFLFSSENGGAGEKDLRYRAPDGEAASGAGEGVPVRTVYVPIYSHVYFGDGKPYLLTATLSIRNTDLVHGIIIKSAKYYDTDGKLVRSYLTKPLMLGPLASKEILVEETDVEGGSGAKFIVEWTAEEGAERPIIEAVMIGATDLRGISFITAGKEIATK
ncbi:MAG: DUF3124 domain-containing protein [Desulfobacteraceae bacterium]|nr:MAG: DUF3124 domain-containing protein [Desulfobacteraceae bacterium]